MLSIPRAPTTWAPDNVGYIVVDELPRDLIGDLAEAGVSEEDLRDLAGRDGVIRGQEELENLFSRIDEPSRALAVVRGRSLFDALRAQVEQNRRRAGEEGGRRFAHDPVLAAVLAGGPSIGPGSNPESVYRIERALADIGLLDPKDVDGDYDAKTMEAVERLQLEAELPITSRVDAPTLGALITLAPEPGARLVRRPEYDRMREGERMTITVALGAGDRPSTRMRAEAELVTGLLDRGFSRVRPDDLEAMGELGLPGRDPHVDVWQGPGTTLFVVMPDDSATERIAATQAASRSNAILFAGRQFAIGETERPRTGLRGTQQARPKTASPDYQLICASGCAAEAAAEERLLARRTVDTDLFTASHPTPERARAREVLGFLDVIRAEGSTDDLSAVLGRAAATERGFLANKSNQTEAI